LSFWYDGFFLGLNMVLDIGREWSRFLRAFLVFH
jgi:hypothetical protein